MIRNKGYKGVIVDAEVGQPISNAKIRAFDEIGRTLSQVCSNSAGQWFIEADPILSSIEFSACNRTSLQLGVSTLEKKKGTHIRLLSLAPVGYLGQLDATSGESLSLRVHAASNWKYTLCRHGLKKETITESEFFNPVIQTAPYGSIVSEGLNWPVTKVIELPTDLESGLYSITITDIESRFFSMPLVLGCKLKCKIDSKRFLVLANTNTWQAYNVWGGKSRYRNFYHDPVSGGVRPVSATRYSWNRVKLAIKRRVLNFLGTTSVSGIRLEPKWITESLSVSRPFPNRWLNVDSPETKYLDHLAANEWRGLAWLERENFKYHYCSDRMLEHGEISLENYQGVILIGHAEYWTKTMYERLAQATVGRGLPFINLSGNSIYQEVRLDSHGNMRPMHGDFRETCIDPIDNIGVFTDLNISGFAPYKLIQKAKSHWVFKDVQFPNEDGVFGKFSLLDTKGEKDNGVYDPLAPGTLRGNMSGTGASGWEIDKTKKYESKNDMTLLAKGMNIGGGAHLFIIENEQRFLFSASSIAYVSSLLVDEICSKITKNVLQRVLFSDS
jgi:N,N-dimethylformamidase